MSEKIKKPFYKKWWVWVATIFIVAIIATSCGDDEAKPASTEPKAEKKESKKEEKTEFGINEPIEFQGRILEVTDVKKSDGDDFDKPKEGKEYVIVTVNITNNSDDKISYNQFDFKMKNSQGQIEEPALSIIDNDTSLSSGELAAGGNVSGTIVFEQPKDDEQLELIFSPSFWSNKEVSINLN